MEGQRQASGALIFPASQSELKANKERKELQKELAEVRQLKEELKELLEKTKQDKSEE